MPVGATLLIVHTISRHRLATITQTSDVIRDFEQPTDWARWRFAASTGLYGAALGAAVTVTNVVGQTSKFAPSADRLPLTGFLYFAVAGGIAGLLIAGAVGYFMGSSPPVFKFTKPRSPLGYVEWAGIGVGYWFAFAVIVGGAVLPEANVFRAYVNGAISLFDVVGFSIDNVFAFPLRIATEGTQFMFTAIPAGIAFGLGGWLLDRFATSGDKTTSSYGPLLLAAAFAGIVMAGLLFLPEPILWQIGNFTTGNQVAR